MDLVFDVETDDLKATKIHCIVAIDEHDNIYKFKPDEIDQGVKFLSKADKLIGHNITGFDIPVIKNLTGVDVGKEKEIVDTLLLSRLLKPNREGGHSLETWGYRLKFHKAEQPDFLTYSDAMLKYCEKDVQLNKMLLRELQEEAKGFSKESICLEHDVADILQQQQLKGFKFNKAQEGSSARDVIKMSGQELNPTIEDKEIEGVIKGLIKKPTGIFKK